MTDSEIRVSVVIPVRNGLPFLLETIESAYQQLGPNDELVIHENFSTDGTKETLRKYSQIKKIRTIEADRPLSAAENWTVAVGSAAGKYIKVLCADDILLPGIIEKQSKLLLENPKCVMVSNRRSIIDGEGKIIFSSRGLNGLLGVFSGKQALDIAIKTGTNTFGETSAVMYEAKALKLELPFTDKYPYLTDLEMHSRVLSHGGFIGSKEVLSSFRVHGNSWSNSLAKDQYSQMISWLNEQDNFLNLPITLKKLVTLKIWVNTEVRKLIFQLRRNAVRNTLSN